MTRSPVVVVGGGLAGVAAALELRDRGVERVVLVERRSRLGGLTWSFRHGDLWVDNGQHVFLRCCSEYIRFLGRIDAQADVEIQPRLDVPVVAPGPPGGPPRVGRIRRSSLHAPLHLAGALLRYPHLPLGDRLRLGRPLLGLLRARLEDPELDRQAFGAWLESRGQSGEAVRCLWDLITVPTVNLAAGEASLAVAAKVFKTGLLERSDAADIGWSRVPLGRLHGERAAAALSRAGVEIRTGERVRAVLEQVGNGDERFEVVGRGWRLGAGAVVVAVPHQEAAQVLPQGCLPHQESLTLLGASPIVDVHLVFDRQVTSWPLMAAVHSPLQWVFDRSESSGLQAEAQPGRGKGHRRQYLAVSLSAAGEWIGRHPAEIVSTTREELARLLPACREAQLIDGLVTKERNATFAARPGTASLRPAQATRLPGLAVAGAWTATGWPATMEGAVRSGRSAAEACLGALPEHTRPMVREEVA